MALKSTVFRVGLSIADIDRGQQERPALKSGLQRNIGSQWCQRGVGRADRLRDIAVSRARWRERPLAGCQASLAPMRQREVCRQPGPRGPTMLVAEVWPPRHGFLRVRCTDCHAERLVAFSCKRRGFYSGHPALRPVGQPAAVQNRPRRFCLPELRCAPDGGRSGLVGRRSVAPRTDAAMGAKRSIHIALSIRH